MEGFALARANLEHIHLERAGEGRANLAYADLSRANLTSAHLFNADLHGANLLKADLHRANLNRTRLAEANLLGARLEECRLEYVDWGRRLLQERMAIHAHRAGQREQALALFMEAEEIYRSLAQVSESGGHTDREGWFFRKQMIMRRKQFDPLSLHRAWLKIVDLVCGYGELPVRVIGFALSVVLFSALIYFLHGVSTHEGPIGFSLQADLWGNVVAFLNCVYYSVITFTTVGYGDIVPVGAARAVAAAEAFVGAFTMALFVVVFDKKMTR